METAIHHPGELAYLDSFAGLIPVKVLRVDESTGEIFAKVTASRSSYRRGQVVKTANSNRMVPRANVRRNRIFGSWQWVNRATSGEEVNRGE